MNTIESIVLVFYGLVALAIGFQSYLVISTSRSISDTFATKVLVPEPAPIKSNECYFLSKKDTYKLTGHVTSVSFTDTEQRLLTSAAQGVDRFIHNNYKPGKTSPPWRFGLIEESFNVSPRVKDGVIVLTTHSLCEINQSETVGCKMHWQLLHFRLQVLHGNGSTCASEWVPWSPSDPKWSGRGVIQDTCNFGNGDDSLADNKCYDAHMQRVKN